MKWSNLDELVQQVLERVKETRSDDFKLWIFVANEIYDDNGYNPSPGETDLYIMPVWQVMRDAKELGLPAFETVSRTRRAVQAKHPELCDEKTKQRRAVKEQEMHDKYSAKEEDTNFLDWSKLYTKDTDDDSVYWSEL